MADARSSSWWTEEPGLRAMWRETMRLWRRALRRPLLVLAVPLAVSAWLAFTGARHKIPYSASVILVVTESDFDVRTTPRPTRKLRAFVRDVAFSDAGLQAIATERGLYGGLARRDPVWAVQKMRDDIDVEVSRNYFLKLRLGGEPLRSARIAISFRSSDPALAEQVVQDLVRLVIEAEQEDRQTRADAVARASRKQLDLQREKLAEMRAEYAVKTARLHQGAPSTASYPDGGTVETLESLIVDIGGLRESIRLLQESAERLEPYTMSLELRASMERGHVGMQFQIAEQPPPPPRPPAWQRGLRNGVGALLVLLPLFALCVGAFDPRLRKAEDARRLDLVPFVVEVKPVVDSAPKERTK